MPEKGLFTSVKLKDLTDPQEEGAYELLIDHWWCVDDCGRYLFYNGTGLCSPYKRSIMERVTNKNHPVARIRLIKRAFVPLDNYFYEKEHWNERGSEL